MFKLSVVASALNAQMIGADALFNRFSTDTRQILAGDLFVALRGERFDASDFVHQAVAAGAVAAVVHAESVDKILQHPEIESQKVTLLAVSDTRLALGQLAAFWRDQYPVPMIGLTGSNGKTTVKEMIASILCCAVGADAVLATQGNLNNDIGLPLTLGRLNAQHKFAVIEMGMNHAGEIDYLTRIARPQVALINNASGAHLAGLGSVAGVAQAKGEIFAGLPSDGIAIINADDPHAAMWRALAGGHRCIEFGLNADSMVSGRWQNLTTGTQLEVTTPSGRFAVQLQVQGEHNVRNALAATAATWAMGIALPKIAEGLSQFGGVAGRLQPKKGAKGATLIDDTYNANPASMRAAVQVLAAKAGKRIFVVGDMGELGEDAPQLHAEIGCFAKESGIDDLFALGELSLHAAQAFGATAQCFTNLEALQQALKDRLTSDVTILVKGSRFMKMERVVQALMPDAGGE